MSTKNQFLEDYTITKIQNNCSNIDTIEKSLKSNLPTISLIKKEFGSDFIQAYIEGWIVNIREFVNVGKKMTDIQTQETASIIVREYYNLNISDINLIFRNAKLGLYGKIYDRLDGMIILDWFEQFFNKRCSIAAEQSIQESESYKWNETERISSNQKISDVIKSFRK